jgi:hypothetical protein
MRFAIENRRWAMLAAGVLAFFLGMPEILQAQEVALGTAVTTSPAQLANGDEPSGSSEGPESTDQGRRRGWGGYYYYPCYYYRHVHYVSYPVVHPVVTYPVVTYPVVTYPVATVPTVIVPTYGPQGALSNGTGGSGNAEGSALEQVANGPKNR